MKLVHSHVLALMAATLFLVGAVVPLADADAASAVAARRFVLDRGHLDLFEVTYDAASSQLVLQVKDDTRLYGADVAFRDPGNVTIDVDAAAASIEVPDLAEYAFLGPAGSTVYLLPEVQDDRLPWPGWSTQRLLGTLPAGVELAAGSPVHYELDIAGPGDVFTFASDAAGAPTDRSVDTTYPAPDVIHAGPNTHAHANWVFTEVGDYHLTVTPSATTLDGAALTGPARSYHFHVGEPLLADIEGPALTVSGASPTPYTFGAPIELSVTQNPQTQYDDYAWYRWVEQPASGGGFHYESVGGPSGATLRTTATLSTQYYVQLHAPNGRVVADAAAWVQVDPPPPDPGPDDADPNDPGPAPHEPMAAAFSSIVPVRLLDTRSGSASAGGAAGTLQPEQPLSLTVGGRAGVPVDASAAILNVTVVDAAEAGYLSIWPCDTPRPLASSVNYAAGWTVANSVIATLSAGGAICLATTGAAAHLVVDVTGYAAARSAYASLTPARLVDTRSGAASADGASVGAGVVQPGVPLVVQVAGRGGVPADADAAVLNVTVTDAPGGGYVTVWPCDAPQPWASTVNFAAGWTIANGAVARLAADGTVCLTTGGSPGHLVVDVAGVPVGA